MGRFQRATREKAKLRLALIGPAGSGKTYTAMALAEHLVPGGRVAVIDSERGSAAKYARTASGDVGWDFDMCPLARHHPKEYIDAIREAEAAGYDVLIIDSLSHAWAGKDGALELVDAAAAKKHGNSFAAWGDVTPLQNELIDTLLAVDCHLIVTMRSKMAYVQEEYLDDKGRKKTEIRKVGMQPVQRSGVEFEFDVVGDLDDRNVLSVTKSRCPSLNRSVIAEPGRELAEMLRTWLETGEAPRTDFASRLTAISGLDLPTFAAFCTDIKKLRPSEMRPDQQAQALVWLDSDSGRAKIRAWLEQTGRPIPQEIDGRREPAPRTTRSAVVDGADEATGATVQTGTTNQTAQADRTTQAARAASAAPAPAAPLSMADRLRAARKRIQEARGIHGEAAFAEACLDQDVDPARYHVAGLEKMETIADALEQGVAA